MTDDEILAAVMRRFLNDDYNAFAQMTAPGLFCIDGTIEVSPLEAATISGIVRTYAAGARVYPNGGDLGYGVPVTE